MGGDLLGFDLALVAAVSRVIADVLVGQQPVKEVVPIFGHLQILVL